MPHTQIILRMDGLYVHVQKLVSKGIHSDIFARHFAKHFEKKLSPRQLRESIDFDIIPLNCLPCLNSITKTTTTNINGQNKIHGSSLVLIKSHSKLN